MHHYVELYLLKQFPCFKPCINNGRKKQKLLDHTKKCVEDKLEFLDYFNNIRLVKHLNTELMVKEGNENVLDEKIDLYISTDEEILIDPNKNLDKLFVTEKLEEVEEVISSHITSDSDDGSSM